MNTSKFSGFICAICYLCLLIFVIPGTRATEDQQSLQDALANVEKMKQDLQPQVKFQTLKPNMRNPKFAFALNNLPAEGPFRFGNFSIPGLNDTQIFGPFDPVTSTLLMGKAGLLAMLSAAKSILPPLVLIAAVTLIVAVGAAFLVCTVADCDGIGGGGDIFRRHSYEHDYDKYRPIYQAIDEDYKHKYKHLARDKEY